MRFKTCKDCGIHFKTKLVNPKYCDECKEIRIQKSIKYTQSRPNITFVSRLARPIYERKIRTKIQKIRKRMKYYYKNQNVKVRKQPHLTSYSMFQMLESEMFRLYRESNCKYKVINNFCKITKNDILF